MFGIIVCNVSKWSSASVVLAAMNTVNPCSYNASTANECTYCTSESCYLANNDVIKLTSYCYCVVKRPVIKYFKGYTKYVGALS